MMVFLRCPTCRKVVFIDAHINEKKKLLKLQEEHYRLYHKIKYKEYYKNGN